MRLLFFFFLISLSLSAQVRIDGDFAFQTDPAKKYSLYIPSAYDENTPHRLMIGFHPFNTNRWDAESWCDTLIQFAETNNLILACPDGGVDGQVDDPIDTAFTTALIDSVFLWYNINAEKVYAMGFSWGGRTTYSYGLNHSDRFRGFLPIGAAIEGTNQVTGVIQNAENKPFYLVHGSQDNPNVRFYPIIEALENTGALVNSQLMSGVGHTIDFPNRNTILTTAFIWIDSVNCAALTPVIDLAPTVDFQFEIYPNPTRANQSIQLQLPERIQSGAYQVRLESVNGRSINNWERINQPQIILPNVAAGIYYLRIITADGQQSIKSVLIQQ